MTGVPEQAIFRSVTVYIKKYIQSMQSVCSNGISAGWTAGPVKR